MAKNTFKRTERKYMLSPQQNSEMLKILFENMDPDDYSGADGGYNVYNIYYDNDKNSVIRNSVSKPPYKEKLRVRSYETPDENNKVYVEIKKKIQGVVSKRRVSMTLRQVEPFLKDGIVPEGKSPASQQMMKEILYFQSIYHSVPALYLSYGRYAFKGKVDRNFRVTVDHDIVTRRYDLRLDKGSYGDSLIGDNCLMEVKFVGTMPLWLVQAIRRLDIKKVSFSKYGTEYEQYRKAQLGR
ncbi:MAG TPA: polyphosphate polymerase domain-containing protein [Bacillota bacterium]|nr:polyphosphate polymerase domain-containing protein [Bacillota bacterium]